MDISIAEKAFLNNKYLKKIVVGNNVHIIRAEAFYGCKNLSSLLLGKRVTSIEAKAFAKCTSLKKLTFPAGVSSRTTVNVPRSKLKTYRRLFRQKGLHKKVNFCQASTNT